jgi:hypothetical protein
MAPLFDVVPEMMPGESFAMMEEVLYMPGTEVRKETRSGGKSEG